MTHNVHVKDLLKQLAPLAGKPMSYDQFLNELSENLDRADSAAALIVRSIEACGQESPDEETDQERKQYLMMLRDMKVPSYKAFKHVAGSQRFAMSPLAWLRRAADGGVESQKGMIVIGGPGAGKDFFKDGFIRALENGATAYAIKGCKDAESPLNLLKLFEREKPEILKELATATGLGDKLYDLLKLAGDPCQHCYKKVMGDVTCPKDSPCFEDIEVVPVKINRRAIGIAEWQPGGDVSLVNALRQAQRGFISMPDAFIHREIEPGKTDERLILLDAPQYRRLPGLTATPGEAVPFSPLDTFIFATTNEKALEQFLNELPDKDAFTGRFDILKLPYNTIRVEEVRAYRETLKRMKKTARFDPLVLHIVATLAVISRFPVPEEGSPFVHPIERMRLYQGDPITVKPRTSSDWSSVWSTSSSSGSYGSYGNDRYGSSSRSSSSSTTGGAKLNTEEAYSTEKLWTLAGREEGLSGLDMRFMLGIISSLNAFGLRMGEGKCVSSISTILLLRRAIASKLNTPNLTEDQKETFKRCLKWLGGKPTDHMMALEPGTAPTIGTDQPELIESEYRRLLKQQVLRVLCPDYEARAQALYDDYKLFATQWFLDSTKLVKHPKMGTVPINVELIDELDRFRLGKRKSDSLSDEDKKFRRSLETLLSDARDEFIQEHGEERAKEFKESWDTITPLANAIRAKLDAEIAEVANKLLSTEVLSELSDDEQKKLIEAKQALIGMGYCEDSLKPVLEYAKRVKVWAHKG